ncbi:hypothetical protein B0O80DRAFT_126393 [Mortierella sp. GBAus27b]|nr:hypothetical protein B0O80DRAFT_126393 [Mortierella sp. GBAus27b]
METITTPATSTLDFFRTLSPDVRRRVKGLKGLQNKHTALQTEFNKEILALEKKYLELYTPLYQRRAELVSGKSNPTNEEVAAGNSDDEGNEDEEEEDKDDDDKDAQHTTEGVPNFWLVALKNNSMLKEAITQRDEDALKHLVDIRLSYFEQPGFRLDFEFSPNEFFTNTILSKSYFCLDQPAYGGDYLFDRAEGTKIDWKEGHNLSLRVETKKQRHKGSNKTRIIKKVVPSDTFFSFFTPPEAREEDPEDDDADAELDQLLQSDYLLGEEIRDNIIPHAVDWFTGKAPLLQGLDDQYDDEFLYEDEDDDEDGDEDDEDEDDDEDDGDLPAKDDKTPECKQQ